MDHRRRPDAHRSGSIVALAVLAGPLLHAVELVERDAVVRLEIPPGGYEYAVDGANGGFTGTGSYGSRFVLAGLVRRSFADPGDRTGLTGVIGPAVGWAALPAGSRTWAELRGSLGLGVQLDPAWTMSLDAQVAVGADRLQLDGDATVGSYSGYGAHVAGGPELRVAWSPMGTWRISASAGWRMERALTDDGATRITVRGSGPVFAIAWELPLSQAPGALE
jgi:hypothetical protein